MLQTVGWNNIEHVHFQSIPLERHLSLKRRWEGISTKHWQGIFIEILFQKQSAKIEGKQERRQRKPMKALSPVAPGAPKR